MDNLGVILDFEGTILNNGSELPGAVEMLGYLMNQEIPFRIITNTISKSLRELSNKTLEYGLDIPEDFFINPLVPLVRFLRERKTESFFLVGPEIIKNSLNINSTYESIPEYVILCDFENIDCDYELLNKIFGYLMEGSKLLTMSNSPYYISKKGIRLDTGSFTSMFESLTGNQAILFGKPSEMMYKEASNQMRVTSSQIIAIGDDVLTDIKGANDFGAYSVLVKTGKYKIDDETRVEPNQVISNLTELIQILESRKG